MVVAEMEVWGGGEEVQACVVVKEGRKMADGKERRRVGL
jgi:hypothetical protein